MDHEETIRRWDEKIEEIRKLEYNIEDININNENHKLIHEIIDFQKGQRDIACLVKKIALNCIISKVNQNTYHWGVDRFNLNNEYLKESSFPVIFKNATKEVKEKAIMNKYIDNVISDNRELMINKNKNYGSSWSIMRPIGITDIIHVKIHRIDSLISGEKNYFESTTDSFEDILNYCVFLLIMMDVE